MQTTETELSESNPNHGGTLLCRLMCGTAVLVVVAIGVLRYTSGYFERHIEIDEFFTLQDYTWAGVLSDGSRNELRRYGDIEELGFPSIRQMGMGVYCSIGRWHEPNNHVGHTFLVNVCLALFDDPVVATRVPALVAAVLFAMCMIWLCNRCGWPHAAPLAGVLALVHPYVYRYSQESRGYALVMLLATLMLVLWTYFKNRSHSARWSIALILVSIVLFQTVVSMSIDWVLPIYATVFLLPNLALYGVCRSDPRKIRKAVGLQLFAIVSFGLFVVADRLPYLYSSAIQYGIPTPSLESFLSQAWKSLDFLFYDTPQLVFAGLGFAGCILCLSQGPTRGRATMALCCAALTASMVHFIAAQRWPYTRVLGYCLIPCCLGYACLLETLIGRFYAFRHSLIVGTFACTMLLFPWPLPLQTPQPNGFETMAEAVGESRFPNRRTYYALGTGLITEHLLFPADWSQIGADAPAEAGADCVLHFVSFKNSRFPFDRNLEAWPEAVVEHELRYRSLRLLGRLETLERLSDQDQAILIYYPDPQQVAVAWNKFKEFFESNAENPFFITRRYQVKLDVYGRLDCVLVSGSSSEQVQRLRESLQTAENRFGGSSVALIPDASISDSLPSSGQALRRTAGR